MSRSGRIAVPANLLALVVCDTLLLSASYLAAAYWTQDDLGGFLLFENGYLRLGLLIATLQTTGYFQDLYSTTQLPSRILFVQKVCLTLGIGFLLQAALNYVPENLQVPLNISIYGGMLVLLVWPSWRILFARFVHKAIPTQRLLFVGMTPLAQDIIAGVQYHADSGYEVMGYVAGTPQTDAGAAFLGSPNELEEVMLSRQPNRVVFGGPSSLEGLPIRRLLDLQWYGVRLQNAAAFYESVFRRIPTRDLHPDQLVLTREFDPRRTNILLQNIYSWLLAFVLFWITLPLLLMAALSVKLSSPGPVFLREARIGFRGNLFSFRRFRCTEVNNPSKVTPLGRWLRRLHLDGLPQLWTVLRGQMTLVGPEPDRPEFAAVLERHIPFYRHRYSVKPGLTGWAQINYTSAQMSALPDPLVRLGYDLYYIKRLVPALDVYIILHSIKTLAQK